MEDYIASGGFWHCVWLITLALFGSAIFGGIMAGLIFLFLKKIREFQHLMILYYFFGITISFFYIWDIRDSIGWFFIGIIMAIPTLIFGFLTITGKINEKNSK
jgi:hypothetical protein